MPQRMLVAASTGAEVMIKNAVILSIFAFGSAGVFAQDPGRPTTSNGYCFEPSGTVAIGLVASCSSINALSIPSGPVFTGELDSSHGVELGLSVNQGGFNVTAQGNARTIPGANIAAVAAVA